MPVKKVLSDELMNEHVFSVLDLSSLSDSERILLLDKMAGLVNTRLLERLFASLESELQDKLNGLLEKGTENELESFISVNCPEFIDWVPEEAVKLKTELIGKMYGE